MKVCCIKKEDFPSDWVNETLVINDDIFSVLKNKQINWIEREIAENDITYKQLIPYVLVKNSKNQFACYPRHGNEKRLHGLYSCGVGGHVDEVDNCGDLKSTLLHGMKRELSEEFQNFNGERILEENIELKFLGGINEVETKVGLTHFAIVFLAECRNDFLPIPAEELKGLEWKSLQEIREIKKELWSEMAFKLVKWKKNGK